MGDAILVPTVYASLDSLSSRHFKGRISSVTALIENTGYFFGPLAAGFAAHFFGFPVTFFGFGIFILFVMGVAIFTKFH